jgi:hypothetical protein
MEFILRTASSVAIVFRRSCAQAKSDREGVINGYDAMLRVILAPRRRRSDFPVLVQWMGDTFIPFAGMRGAGEIGEA